MKLARWRAFVKHVNDMYAAIRRDGMTPATEQAIRVMFLSLGLPEKHLSREQLETAVRKLHQFTLQLGRFTAEEAKERIIDAVELRRFEEELQHEQASTGTGAGGAGSAGAGADQAQAPVVDERTQGVRARDEDPQDE